MTDPLSGRDGTQAVGGADALAPAPRPPADESALPGALLPALPVAADQAGAARWMEADAAEGRRLTDPPAPVARVDGGVAEVDGHTARVRDAGPARVLPRREPPRPAPSPWTPSPGPRAVGPGEVDDDAPADDEPEWLRVRREEHEFRSQFGEWRAGAARPTGGSRGLSPLTLLILAVLVVIVVLIALS